MDDTTLLIAALGAFAIVASLGVLLTRDNFYAALYMAVTMVSIAGVYAVYNLQPVVVMIVLIFVGAVGIITIAIAATYRFAPSRKIDLVWTGPVVVVFGVVAYFYYRYISGSIELPQTASHNFASISTNYFFVILFLVSLMILMMLSAVKLAWRGER